VASGQHAPVIDIIHGERDVGECEKTPDMCSESTSSAEALIDERLVIVLFADDG
jgi:hypothetical protein